jgi:hypothetical protein
MQGLGLVFYGGEGVGKTSLALQFGNLGKLLCASIKETGFDDLAIHGDLPKSCRNIQVDTFEELNKVIKEDYDVLVLDSCSGLQQILFEYVCRVHYEGRWDGKDGFSSYYKGQRVDSPPVLAKFLDALTYVRQHGKHVILIGHMVTTTEPNTLGADYLSHVIDMDQGDKGGIRSLITKWAQAVLFMNIDVSITRSTTIDNKTKTVMEGKAKDDDVRLMYTTKAPGHSAKNRLNLPPIINMGDSPKKAFENFWKELPQAYQDLL